MKARGSRVRTKVVALLLSLFALWAFAAFVTLRDGLNLLSAATLDTGVGRPAEALVAALQQEREASLVYLGGHSDAQRTDMLDRRTATDETRAAFETSVVQTKVRWTASDQLRQRIDGTVVALQDLDRTRASIDANSLDRDHTGRAFGTIVDAAFRIYGSLATLDDPDIAKDSRTLVTLTRAQEVLAQETSQLAGVLAVGHFAAGEQIQFTELVGSQRFLYSEAVAELPAPDRDRYQAMADGPAFRQFRALEDRVIQARPDDPSLPVTAAQWNAAVAPVQEQLRSFVLTAADSVLTRAKPVATWVIVRLALAGGLGLIAVIASIVISITTARNLVRQLERLRNAARDLASYRLPRVVERLQHGERVDVDAEAPPLDFGRDEIGQVGEAFNQVQETAIRVAVEQAELRRSVRDVFLSLARRSQALLHRQLGLLDAMERRATDSEELAELFRIDHLATRMRRNAENLIVLSGATAGRAWRKPVAMVDVLRGALAEVEDYTRVTVLPVGSASLLGRAVGDVIHLLAELIENAVSFSPPQTVVRVGGSVVGYGFAIEIEDRGLGMSAEEIEAANEQLRNPPEFRLTSTARLGLYVVGKLAERHGIKVRLTESPYGGTTAIVLLPGTLMADDGSDGSADSNRVLEDEPIDDGRSVQLAGVGRHRLQAAAAAATQVEPAITGADYYGSSNGATANGHTNGAAPHLAPSALTAVTPVSGTPVVPPAAPTTGGSLTVGSPGLTPSGLTPSGLTPSGLPTRPVPAQAGTPSIVDGPAPSVAPPTVAPTSVAPPTVAPPSVAPPAGPVSTPMGMGAVGAPPLAAPPLGTAPLTPADEATAAGVTGAEPHRLTPAGLPWRQRPANPVESTAAATGATATGWTAVTPADGTQAATTPATGAPAIGTLGGLAAMGAAAGTADPAPSPRGPDQTRSLMSSYRSGTLRGRNDAARLAGPEVESPQWTDPAPPSVSPTASDERTPSASPSEWTPSTPTPEEEG